MTDIMIDLETLSTRSDAAIISIGACIFDLKTGEITDTFYKAIGLFDQKHYGHIDPETVSWWLEQPDDTRLDIASTSGDQTLYEALIKLREFVRRHLTDSSRLWSNGSSFDLVILRNAYQRNQMNVIWKYWQERDCRTIYDLAKDICGIDVKSSQRTDTPHHALDDAIDQSKNVSWAYRSLANYGDE